MDPLTSLLESLDQAASTRSPSAQDVLAHENAPAEQVAPQRTTTAPSEQVALQRTTTAPWSSHDAPLPLPYGEESSLSPASPEITLRPRWDDLGKSYDLNHNLMHKFIPSFSFKATATKPRSSSSSSSWVVIPCLGCDPPPPPPHPRMVRINQVSPTTPLTRIGATSEQLERHGGSRDDGACSNWPLGRRSFMSSFLTWESRRTTTGTTSACLPLWKLDGPLEDAPVDETPTSALLHTTHAGPLPPIWDLLDCAQPQVETLHLLNLEEFTDLVNECAPDALLRDPLHGSHGAIPPSQGPGASRCAHLTIGNNLEEKIRLRDQGPDIEASAQSAALLTNQLAAMSTKHQQAQAATTFYDAQTFTLLTDPQSIMASACAS